MFVCVVHTRYDTTYSVIGFVACKWVWFIRYDTTHAINTCTLPHLTYSATHRNDTRQHASIMYDTRALQHTDRVKHIPSPSPSFPTLLPLPLFLTCIGRTRGIVLEPFKGIPEEPFKGMVRGSAAVIACVRDRSRSVAETPTGGGGEEGRERTKGERY
jgi:hypothetical protein